MTSRFRPSGPICVLGAPRILFLRPWTQVGVPKTRSIIYLFVCFGLLLLLFPLRLHGTNSWYQFSQGCGHVPIMDETKTYHPVSGGNQAKRSPSVLPQTLRRSRETLDCRKRLVVEISLIRYSLPRNYMIFKRPNSGYLHLLTCFFNVLRLELQLRHLTPLEYV